MTATGIDVSADTERLAALLHAFAIGCSDDDEAGHLVDARDLISAGVLPPYKPKPLPPDYCPWCGSINSPHHGDPLRHQAKDAPW